MAPPRLGETPAQDFVAAVKKQQLHIERRIMGQPIEAFAQGFRGKVAGAAVHAHRERPHELAAGKPVHQGQG